MKITLSDVKQALIFIVNIFTDDNVQNVSSAVNKITVLFKTIYLGLKGLKDGDHTEALAQLQETLTDRGLSQYVEPLMIAIEQQNDTQLNAIIECAKLDSTPDTRALISIEGILEAITFLTSCINITTSILDDIYGIVESVTVVKNYEEFEDIDTNEAAVESITSRQTRMNLEPQLLHVYTDIRTIR